MARRHDQQRVGRGLADRREGAEDWILLARQRAGGNHHRAVAREGERCQQRIAVAARRVLDRRRGRRIELQAAAHRHAVRVGADVDEPAAPVVGLRADAVDVRQHAPHEAAHAAVASVRPIGDPTVRDQRGDAAPPAGTQQRRPQFGVDQHEQRRGYPIERARHGPRKIERRVDHRIHLAVTREALRHRLAGHRRRRQNQPVRRIGVAERAGQRPCRQGLAHRHRVDPDGGPPLRVHRRRQTAEALADIAGALSAPPRRIRHRRQPEQGVEDEQRGIDRIHAVRRPTL